MEENGRQLKGSKDNDEKQRTKKKTTKNLQRRIDGNIYNKQ